MPRITLLSPKATLPFIIFILATQLPLQAHAASDHIYISNSGTGNGSSCASPRSAAWFNTPANWGNGPGQIAAGDTVHLCGTLSTQLAFKGSGTAGAPITLRFENGAKMSRPDGWQTGAIELGSQSHLVIDGGANGIIESTDNGTNKTYQQQSIAVQFHDGGKQSDDVVIQNLTMRTLYQRAMNSSDSRAHGFGVAGPFGNDVTVRNNRISFAFNGISGYFPAYQTRTNYNVYGNVITNSSTGITLGSGWNDAVLNDSSLHDNEIVGDDTWAGCFDGCTAWFHNDGIHVWAKSSAGSQVNNLKVYNNYIHGTYHYVTAWIYLEGSPGQINNALVYNNLLENDGPGYPGDGFIYLAATTNAKVFNNTIVGDGKNGDAMQVLASKGAQIENNIFTNIGRGIGVLDASGVTSDHNVFYNFAEAYPQNRFSHGGKFMSFETWQASGRDVHSVIADPKLNSRYVPQAGSSALGVGANLSSYFTTDRAGKTRPSGGAWDAGAYQSGLAPAPAPIPTPAPTPAPAPVSGSYPVYQGCEIPASSYSRTVYIDPATGSDSGDGTQASPLRTLEAALYAKKITGGDHVVLMAGNHGTLVVSQYNTPQLVGNAKWIWLDFRKGATANSLSLLTTSRFLVTNAELTNGDRARNGSAPLLNISDGSNIVVADSSIHGATDTSGWKASDWLNAPNGGQARNVSCFSLLRTRITNIEFGFNIFSDTPGASAKAYLYGNEIGNFAGDGFRPNESDIIFRNNYIHDAYVGLADGDENHDDGIQIFALGANRYKNITIDSNLIQETTNPNRRFNASMQGIGYFDGPVDNLRITNNTVLISGYHGISAYGPTNSVIENNTVANPTNNGFPSWIYLPKNGSGTNNNIVRNNIADRVMGENATFTNNFQNLDPIATFTTFDRAGARYNFVVKPGSPAYGTQAGVLNGGFTPSQLPGVVPTPTPTPAPVPAPKPCPPGEVIASGLCRPPAPLPNPCTSSIPTASCAPQPCSTTASSVCAPKVKPLPIPVPPTPLPKPCAASMSGPDGTCQAPVPGTKPAPSPTPCTDILTAKYGRMSGETTVPAAALHDYLVCVYPSINTKTAEPGTYKTSYTVGSQTYYVTGTVGGTASNPTYTETVLYPAASGSFIAPSATSGASLGASAALFSNPLKPGSTGVQVSALQTLLKLAGYYAYPESTGYFGNITKQAVAKLQKEYGLEQVGAVGAKTQALLNLLTEPNR